MECMLPLGPGFARNLQYEFLVCSQKLFLLKLAADLLLKIKKGFKIHKVLHLPNECRDRAFQTIVSLFFSVFWVLLVGVFAIELCSSARSKKMRHYCVKKKENEASAKVD